MQVIVEMVFCFEYCSDLLREKIVLVINKTFSEVTGVSLKFAKVSRSIQQFSQTVKGQNHRGRNIESKTECYEKDKKRVRLFSDHFPTISSHFFHNYLNIFNKTED